MATNRLRRHVLAGAILLGQAFLSGAGLAQPAAAPQQQAAGSQPGQVLFDSDPLQPVPPRREEPPRATLAGCWRYPADGASPSAATTICVEASGAGWQAWLKDDGQACTAEVAATFPAPASLILALKPLRCNKGEPGAALEGNLDCAAQGADLLSCRSPNRAGAQLALSRIGRSAAPVIGRLPEPPKANALAGCWRTTDAWIAANKGLASLCVDAEGRGWWWSQVLPSERTQPCISTASGRFASASELTIRRPAQACAADPLPFLEASCREEQGQLTCRPAALTGAAAAPVSTWVRWPENASPALPAASARNPGLAPGCWKVVNMDALPNEDRGGALVTCFDEAGRGLISVWYAEGKSCVGGVERSNETPDGAAVRFSLTLLPGGCNHKTAPPREQLACRTNAGGFQCAGANDRDLKEVRFEPIRPEAVPPPTRLPPEKPSAPPLSAFDALALAQDPLAPAVPIATLVERAQQLAAQPATPQRRRDLANVVIQLSRRAETNEQRDFVRRTADRLREEASKEAETLVTARPAGSARAELQDLLRTIVLLGMDQRGSSALSELGRLYSESTNAGDIDTARLLWEIAGASGSPAALRNLGFIHERGLGVPVDRDKALQFYRRAKAAGHERVDADIERVLSR